METGKQDEIPLVSEAPMYITNLLGNSFGLHGWANDWVFPRDGVVIMEKVSPEYKELLMFMNRLYKEKLLEPQFDKSGSNLQEIFNQRLASDVGGFYPFMPAVAYKYTEYMKASDPNAKAVVLEPLKGPSGIFVNELAKTEWKRWVITKDCKNPDVAMKVLDFVFADHDGYLLRNFGIEGDTYTLVNGEPQFTEKITKAENMRKAKEENGIYIQCLPFIYAPMTEGEKTGHRPGIAGRYEYAAEQSAPGIFS